MKLPLKWKIFRFANYLMGFAFLFFLCFLANSVIKESIERDDILWITVAGIGMTLIIINSTLNLFITYKIFPNKSLQGKTKLLYIISTILFSITLVGLLALSLYGLNEELENSEPGEDKAGLIAAICLLSLFVIGCYILIMQLLIRRFLNNNYKKTINWMIENIGEE